MLVKKERKTNKIWYHLYVESKIWHKLTYLQNRNRRREQTYGFQGGEREEEGWTENLGLADMNYNIYFCICFI